MENENEEFWGNDDFWNTSTSSNFNFDDDDDDNFLKESIQEKSTETLLNPAREESTHVSINYLISNKCLSLILNDNPSLIASVVPPIEETIKKMFLGYPYNLYCYKTLEDKTALLDGAIAISDGNVILCVIIFLRKTLKLNLFYNILAKRKIAVQHYANYLISKQNLNELADLYMATSNTHLIKNIYYLLCKDCSNVHTLYKKLSQFSIEHATNFSNPSDRNDISQHLSFLKWQIENGVEHESIIDMLANVASKEFENNRNDEKMIEIKKQFKIDDLQYEWTIMNILAKLELWSKLRNLFIGSNWLTKKSTLKSVIRSDLFVIGLSRHKNIPVEELELYLNFVNDPEKVLHVAQKLKAHNFVIKYYVNQRDRQALLRYRDQNQLTSDELILISNTIQANEKRWKN